jgi:hypothetical protein
MGLLDEAIREHLDLKRRRGADPTEVERLEREALGPVRRAQHVPADVMPGPDPADEMDYAEEHAPVEAWAEAPEEAPLFDHGHPSEPEGFAEPETEIAPPPEPERPYEAPRHHEIAEEWDAHPLHEEGPGLEPEAHAPATPPVPAARPDAEPHPVEAAPIGDDPAEEELAGETVEYDVEAELHGRERGEDVLEETPEFLQDTPDHERLWFEQRPPRDFDFDG